MARPAASVAALALTLRCVWRRQRERWRRRQRGWFLGTVAIDGSSTVGPMSEVASELFNDDNPDVRITVGESGTGGGFEKFCAGETDMNDASRPIDEEDEAPICEENSVEYQEMVVANDALTVVVNKENTWATCLTDRPAQDDLGAQGGRRGHQLEPGRPHASPTRSSCCSAPAPTLAPSTTSPTRSTVKRVPAAPTTAPAKNDNNTIQGVQGSEGGMGYFGYSYYEQNADTLTAVEIDSGDGCVAPSAETAQDGTYTPLARPLFIYPSVTDGTDNDALRGLRRVLRGQQRRDR